MIYVVLVGVLVQAFASYCVGSPVPFYSTTGGDPYSPPPVPSHTEAFFLSPQPSEDHQPDSHYESLKVPHGYPIPGPNSPDLPYDNQSPNVPPDDLQYQIPVSKLPPDQVPYQIQVANLPLDGLSYQIPVSKLPPPDLPYHIPVSKLPQGDLPYHIPISKIPGPELPYHGPNPPPSHPSHSHEQAFYPPVYSSIKSSYAIPPNREHNHINDDYYDEHGSQYEFSYQIRDAGQGQEFGHSEARFGTEVKGSYSVLLPDGRRQIVEYTAGPSGYHPVIRYEPAY